MSLLQPSEGSCPISKTQAGPYPLVTTGEEHKTAYSFQFDSEAVCIPLISSTGHGHASLKRVHCQTGKFALGNLLVAAIVKDQNVLSPKYLARYLSFVKDRLIVPLMTGAANMSISVNRLGTIPVEFPSLAEQERLVKLLDEADALRKLRAQADQRTAELIPALFHQMFGDPLRNPNGWVMRLFSEVGKLDRGRSKHRPRDDASLYGGKHPFIQTGDVASADGLITTYNQTYSDKGLEQSRIWPVGTLCITIAANIGKTAILTFPACFPDSLVGFVPGKDVTVDYVRPWLVTMEKSLEESAPQAAQKNINLKILSQLAIPVPPLPLQKIFAARVAEIQTVQAEQIASRNRLDDLFQSLLYRAFNGELSGNNTAEVTTKDASTRPRPITVFVKRPLVNSKGRAAFDCHVLNFLKGDQYLGSTKMEKIDHLVEYHCGVDLGRQPVRGAYGPVDIASRTDVEKLAGFQKWFSTRKTKGEKTDYLPGPEMPRALELAEEFLGERRTEVDALLTLMRPLDTETCEIVATLYASWNDFLLGGKSPTDDEIVDDVRNNWHPEKKKILSSDWKTWLGWMRKNGLVPKGTGRVVGRRRGEE